MTLSGKDLCRAIMVFKTTGNKLNLEGNMADKIQNAYETSKNIYDDVLTQGHIFTV